MANLEEIKNSLSKLGYNAYISNIEGVDYLRGGYESDINTAFDIEIWIKIIDDKYIFIDMKNQTSREVEFKTDTELIAYFAKSILFTCPNL